MKVRINGFDIECTPEEFLRLTREMEVGQLVDEFQTLPDDVKIGPYKPNPNFPNYDSFKETPNQQNMIWTR